MDLSWFYADRKNFVAFVPYLQGVPSSVYNSEFVSCLLDQNWQDLRDEIKLKFFLPYLIYAFSSIVYMKLALEQDEDSNSVGLSIFCFVVLCFWVSQAYIEVCQIKSQKADYFCNAWNYLDLVGLLLVLFVLFQTGLRVEIIAVEQLRVLAAFASCFILVKMFDWLRLFEETAFYVLLVGMTLSDIKAFLLLLMTALMMFGVPIIAVHIS